MTVTPEQIAIVKSTAPVLQEHGLAITTAFYKNLINDHPQLHNYFNTTSQVTGAQPRALANAVLGYATYIDDLPKLAHAVERIAQKHVSLYVEPAQYDLVGQYLISAIGQILGDAATPPIVDAWTAAYGALASVFINREAQLYSETGTWKSWRKFTISKKVVESNTITSFHLAPVDGQKLPPYLPGQYTSLQLFIEKLGYNQSRQYSLSRAVDPEGKTYRISVKKDHDDTENIDGLISNMLHNMKEGDQVELSFPQGEFTVDASDKTKENVPAVLVSAGIGATPLLAILDSFGQPGAITRPVSWIHTSRTAADVPFTAELADIGQKLKFGSKTHLTEAGTRLAVNALSNEELFLDNAKTEYFVCGPKEFMITFRDGLVGKGVAVERIALELFDTGDV